jgi:hypothetical protein
MRFTITREQDRAAVRAYIDRLKPDKQYTVEITQRKSTRSLSQNKLYWLWLSCIEQETGNDKAVLHHEFGMMFLPKMYGVLKDVYIEIPVSTTKLDTVQFKQYLDKLQVFAGSELGIELPNPEDLIFESFYDVYKDRI